MWSFMKRMFESTPIEPAIEDPPTEERTDESIEEVLLKAFMKKETVSLQEALQIPTFAGCINKICDTVSIIPIVLYKRSGDGVEKVDDERVKLLNTDTKDTMTGSAFKKAIVFDLLTNKGGYAFINKQRNNFVSLNYVDADRVGFLEGVDPIFKDYKITVDGRQYEPYQFLKVCRRSKNGYSGKSIVEENNLALTVAYLSLRFEGKTVKRGGNKKGFLESERKIDENAVTALKEGFNKLYSDDNENAIVLNNGVKFKESSNSAVEMQLNENKKANATEICKLFGMPPEILSGGETEEQRKEYIQYCIVPIMKLLVDAINRDLLLEKEKKDYFFDYDATELTRADVKTRYEAYAIGYKNRFLQIEEIRAMENLPDIDLPYFMLGMNDVLYDPKSGDIFMPNMNQFANVKDPAKYPQTGKQVLSNMDPDNPDDEKEEPDKEENENAEDESSDKS
ncbi:MAG: phage portal protein [Butyrivibrio sp.]|nr:phage portal protein [Butyrivibrio sp.]